MNEFRKFKVVSECNHLEVWGYFDSKERAELRIKEGYFKKFMYLKDQYKTLIVINN